ncbi:MAG: POTRA domain-containing protein, partial [Steroidobacteraceae bacterium]
MTRRHTYLVRSGVRTWPLFAVLACLLGWGIAVPAWSAPLLGLNKGRIDIRVDGVPDAMADNVRSYLTLSRYVTRDDLTDPQVRRLADRAVDEATDALRPFGYYAPTIRSRTSWDDPRWIVRLKITPGEPVTMKTVDVEILGAGASDKSLTSLRTTTPLQP